LKLYSYVLDHDYGFAPNPFYGVCTLATCKPLIREKASVGDYVIGTGSAHRKRQGYLVYFMHVDEIMTYDCYWADQRFQQKRPFMHGSKMRAFGDNIYHREPNTGGWLQENSLHTLRDGRPNPLNVQHDTQSEKVLIGRDFSYWGGSGPLIPQHIRNYDGDDICAKRGHRVNFVDGLPERFLAWVRGLEQSGYLSRPLDWPRSG
jgi:hypothetical protein